MVRVIAGQARGRRLKTPKGTATRPTADRVKEAIFSVLQAKIPESRVLDVFAGTGSMAIEALSRGAAKAVLIEKNQGTGRIVKENISLCNFTDFAEIYCEDFKSVLPRLSDRFEVIFVDPPYNQGYVQPVFSLIQTHQLLNPGGVIVLETNSREKELPQQDQLSLVKETVYGDTVVLYYQFSLGEE